jgi:hypothetical protein
VEKLQALVDAETPVRDRSEIPEFQRFVPAGSELRSANDWESLRSDISVVGPTDSGRAESRALKLMALKWGLGIVVLVAGWFLYSQFLPLAIQHAFQPLAVRRVTASSVLPKPSAVAPVRIPTASVVAGPTAEEVAEKRRAQVQELAALQKQKNLAWAASYSPPVSCEHPVDWSAQVECGNQYMRARKLFEQRWVTEHTTGQATGSATVLENASIGGSRN